MSVEEHRRRVAARRQSVLNDPWRTKAACSPYTGYAPAGQQLPNMSPEGLHDQRQAALFCHQFCAVREECLAFAIDTGEANYVWGGTTETERKHLLRKARDKRKMSA